jgi:signal transduction histidine kinase
MVVTAFALAGNEVQRETLDHLDSVVASREEIITSLIARQREQVAILGNEDATMIPSATKRLVQLHALMARTATGTTTILGNLSDEEAAHLSVLLPRTIVTTQFIPVITDTGFISYMIVTPWRAQGVGTDLIAFFDASFILQSIAIDKNVSHIDLAIVQGTHDVMLLQAAGAAQTMRYIGDRTMLTQLHSPYVLALQGEEGVVRAKDYAGIDVLAAYRSLPTIGWGLVATIDQYQTLEPIRRLALAMFGGGLVVVVFATLLMMSVAGRITSPLRELAGKLAGLETKNWSFPRTIRTGNEIEIVDAAAFDLTSRLRNSYEHLEEKVQERTKELREKNAQDHAIFESLDYGLLVTDAKGAIILVNPVGASILGKEMIVGSDITDVMPLVDRDSQPIRADRHPVRMLLTTKEKFVPALDPGFSLIRSEHKFTAFALVASPILHRNECIGAVVLFRDVTENRRVDRMKSEFITLASHQLRTPLASIRWNVEILLSEDEGKLSENQRQYLHEVGAANGRLTRIVESLLKISNLELGNFAVTIELVPLEEALRSVQELFAFDIKTHNVTIDTTNVVPCVIATDSELLKIILQNLLSNAIKYSQENSTVIVSTMSSEKGTSITIVDKGIGIPAHEKDHVFEKLFRGDNARDKDPDGNGLGLYIVKMAADAIGATVRIESEEGKGTKVTVELPQNPSGATRSA